MVYFQVNPPHPRMYVYFMYGVMNFSPGRWEHLWAVCIFKIFPELYLPGKTLHEKLIAASALLYLQNGLIAMAVLYQG